MRHAPVLVTALALWAAMPATPAGAYVRYRTEQGQPYFWPVTCVPVTIYMNGFAQMSQNEVAKSAAAAAHAWSADDVTCGAGNTATHPYLEIVPTLSVAQGPPPMVGYDARNSVIFRTERWSKSGADDAPAYNFYALAITSVFAKPDGHIVDADVEINAVLNTDGSCDKCWANLDGPPAASSSLLSVYDLQNTLTHEFGHFIGLDHTCFSPDLSGRPRPVDDQGAEVPDCFDAPDAVRATVMFDSASSGEVSKRILAGDERNAVCAIYPEAGDPMLCSLDVPNDGVGCAVAPPRPDPAPSRSRSRPAWWLALVVAGAILGVGMRRRRE